MMKPPVLALCMSALCLGCATRSLTIAVEHGPDYNIDDHEGVAAWTTGTSLAGREAQARGEVLTPQLSAAMRQVLSREGSGFNLVDGEDQAQIEAYLQQRGQTVDGIEPESVEDFFGMFGHEIPATAWFQGSLIWVDFDDETGVESAPYSKERYSFREGVAQVHWEVRFVELGTNRRRHTVLKSRKVARTVSGVGVEPAMIDADDLFQECVTDLTGQFSRLWTKSVQNESVALYVGDGFFHMPWEGSEHPELGPAFERMRNGDYAEAQAEYRKILERLEGTGDPILPRLYYDLALSLELGGDVAAALEYYEKALALSTARVISDGRARCRKKLESGA